METVIVTLTKEEAESFIRWRQHQADFEVLLSSNFFNIRNGSAEVHFDGAGNIGLINARISLFHKKPDSIHNLSVKIPLTSS